MNNNNEIIKFEDLFKDEIKQRKIRQNPEQNKNYVYAIIVYLLIMYVFATVLFLVAREIPSFNQTFTESELILENISKDLGGIAFMYSEEFEMSSEEYLDKVKAIGTYEIFIVVVNINNPYYEGLLIRKNSDTGLDELKIATLEGMISLYPTIKQWSEDLSITIYEGQTQEIPTKLTGPTTLIVGPQTYMKHFTLALLNFIIYILLLPAILYFLKVDISYDFKESKAMRGQFFLAVIIGFLYIILGNIFSNYLTGVLSKIFDLAPSVSVNQETIVAALLSNGMVLMIISAVIIGPIVEELIFRKAIFGMIKSDKTALFVSTFIFGVIHLVGEASIAIALVSGISYFVMGFIFGYIYIKSDRNIMVPITVHILSNLLSVIGVLFLL
ncbi:MAG: type II CAAX endopeptidase family protein [Acholeplasmataceae bacterium]|nr:type II CAAX endopeptidase family protein [Acholeplasmataceae bacterium]